VKPDINTYVFVDVETTGARAQRDAIIEIAAIKMYNGEVVDTFQTLLNPNSYIPASITGLTGITENDVADKPYFEDIADELSEFLNSAILVAHNVRFDYSFLKESFRRVGRKYTPRMICTVKLSRALYPDMRRHRLGDLISYHQLSYSSRHRAYDDAFALVQFWNIIHTTFDHMQLSHLFAAQHKRPSLPRHIDIHTIHQLPNSPGIYRMYDKNDAPLYIGKSIDIKKRVLSHFNRDSADTKEFKIAQQVRWIDHIETTGELSALLLESSLVKTDMPLYNRRLRRTRSLSVITQRKNSDGYITTHIGSYDNSISPDQQQIIALYPRRTAAKQSLLRHVTTFSLCPKLCGLESSNQSCFSYQLGKCLGACIGKESADIYNRRVRQAFKGRGIQSWKYPSAIALTEHHPTDDRSTTYIIDKWIITYVVYSEVDCDPHVQPYSEVFDIDAYTILTSYLSRHPEKVTITPYTGIYNESAE
jgi:DNA polymerase-3 subunit epsilon